jgi:hypothetical protein
VACDNPSALACATTTRTGVAMTNLALLDGVRYFVCIRIVSAEVPILLCLEIHV